MQESPRGAAVKPARTWILIADGARGRILADHGAGGDPRAVDGLVFHGDHSTTHDLVSDREGRNFGTRGPRRSAIDPHSDPHRELKRAFAIQLSEELTSGLRDDAYDRLILIASPVTLGDLRAAISGEVKRKVKGEIAHDLTKMPNSDVGAYLRKAELIF